MLAIPTGLHCLITLTTDLRGDQTRMQRSSKRRGNYNCLHFMPDRGRIQQTARSNSEVKRGHLEVDFWAVASFACLKGAKGSILVRCTSSLSASAPTIQETLNDPTECRFNAPRIKNRSFTLPEAHLCIWILCVLGTSFIGRFTFLLRTGAEFIAQLVGVKGGETCEVRSGGWHLDAAYLLS